MESKFSKDTHQARNGIKIDFIGYYPSQDPHYPYRICFVDGSILEARADGLTSNSNFDLVPIRPFSPETHIRADGVEIHAIRNSDPNSSIPWTVKFKNGEWHWYDNSGKCANSAFHAIITREECVRRKAAEPFTVDNCRTRGGRKVLWLAYAPESIGLKRPIVAAIEGHEFLSEYMPNGQRLFEGKSIFDLFKI